MITLTLKKKPYTFPTRWGEFSPALGQTFIRLAREMALFETGIHSFDAFKVAITIAILGLREGKISAFTEEFSENIYRLGEHFTFPYSIHQREDGSRVADITISLSENLLPTLRGVKGYSFLREPSGRMDCSLTAEQYIDSLELMQAYHTTHHVGALENMVQTLYPGIRKATADEVWAVYYNFRGIINWIRNIPSYALIFTTDEPETQDGGQRRSPVGLASSIYSLAKAGYGDINTIKDLPLFSYLAILMQQTIESIRTLAASNMKPIQISERLHLPVDLVLQYSSK